MEDLGAALAALPVAEMMRGGRWVYAGVNGLHVLSIALLVGTIAALDLRLIGLWRSTPVDMLARVLVPVAATGLGCAMLTGTLLFLAGPADYLTKPLFLVKLSIVAIGAGHAIAVHLGGGFGPSSARQRRTGIISLGTWLTALACGRLLGFLD